ncbi:MAG: segregation/condensation protein A [Spirochaetota bacterium]|nr:segregation/condensation protein A [Spirochaetota bacterium]
MNQVETEKSSYIVHIDNFEGPLDLLWDMIKRAKIEITEISISQITDQYIEYLNIMEMMDIHVASQFILMASELLLYKSKALLPCDEIEDEYFVQPLPSELIERLLEYKKYQMGALKLLEKSEYQSDLYTRAYDSVIEEDEGEEEGVYIEMSLYDLINAFKGVIESSGKDKYDEIVLDEIYVSEIINRIYELLIDKDQILFEDILSSNRSTLEIVASFLAILEMTKISKLKLLQNKVFGDIRIFRNF